MAHSNSTEAWVLMALVHRDLDDFDYRNALLLSERLYAVDKLNDDYRFLYAKCLHLNNDYNGSYSVLLNATSVACLNLFARSCLDLGSQQVSAEKQQILWREGAKALLTALEQCPTETYEWGDDLASVTTRNHVPSRASMCNMLGELYTKLENIRASAKFLWQSLDNNPFKLSSYIKLCDIAPDIIDFSTAALPCDVFKDFSLETTRLNRSSKVTHIPRRPSMSTVGISTMAHDKPLPSHDQIGLFMPSLRGDYHSVSLDQLRSLVHLSTKSSKGDVDAVLPPRGDIEIEKDRQIDLINEDIQKMKANEAYKNKHGLHKKPPTETLQQLKVHLMESNGRSIEEVDESQRYSFVSGSSPPRVAIPSSEPPPQEVDSPLQSLDETGIKRRLRKGKKRAGDALEKPVKEAKLRVESDAASIYRYFNIESKEQLSVADTSSGRSGIIEAMNKVVQVLRILANGYMYQSFYHCREAALELQKLDDHQYDTAWVLCTLGKAYYDASDYQNARVFFRRSFCIAPWFCEGVPIYSTCLWYLEKEQELNLLAYKMNENRSHLYEAYIAAGNWTKCANSGNEAVKWFQKAVEHDPTRSYGHALLGYEEWEKRNYLGAKQHFANCMIANKRSYLGWYGIATAYQGMEEFAQAKSLLAETVRLHPHHPLVLYTMAQVLFALEEYEAALDYASRSLRVRRSLTTENLKKKIEKTMQNLERREMESEPSF